MDDLRSRPGLHQRDGAPPVDMPRRKVMAMPQSKRTASTRSPKSTKAASARGESAARPSSRGARRGVEPPAPTRPIAEKGPPDQIPITSLQAARLASISGVSAKDLAGSTVAEIADRFRFVIDPELLFLRRVCGRVVKHNPLTGVDEGVPFATVHVLDTDCSFFGLFPVESPWAWLFPVFCTTEEIGSTLTDACGNFCVWIPKWEIDWIL